MLPAVALGVALGAVAGLVPGFHVNLLSMLVVDRLSGEPAVAVLAAMAAAQTFLGFIPSVLLGIPDEATAMSVLPAHRFALRGRAREAYFLAVAGGLCALMLSIALLPAFFALVPPLCSSRWLIPALVVGTILAVVLNERNKAGAVALLAASAALGFASGGVSEALFPLLSGMFGLSTLLLSLSGSGGTPPQDEGCGCSVGWGDLGKGTVVGTLSGAVVGIAPGIGSSQACVLSSVVAGGNDRTALVSMGAVNVANFVFNMVTLSAVGKARSGVALAVQSAAGGADVFRTAMVAAVLSASASAALSLPLFSLFARAIGRVDARAVSLGVVALVTVMVAVRCGPAGLALLAASTALGLVPPAIGVKRSLCMGCILVPVAAALLGQGMGF